MCSGEELQAQGKPDLSVAPSKFGSGERFRAWGSVLRGSLWITGDQCESYQKIRRSTFREIMRRPDLCATFSLADRVRAGHDSSKDLGIEECSAMYDATKTPLETSTLNVRRKHPKKSGRSHEPECRHVSRTCNDNNTPRAKPLRRLRSGVIPFSSFSSSPFSPLFFSSSLFSPLSFSASLFSPLSLLSPLLSPLCCLLSSLSSSLLSPLFSLLSLLSSLLSPLSSLLSSIS